ncbi:MAG TPA: hypothetical protein VME24_07005 [Alphaproteobacteria bacterium]|nr:hypothetical protein [Alphaproteobacteria bacterium]
MNLVKQYRITADTCRRFCSIVAQTKPMPPNLAPDLNELGRVTLLLWQAWSPMAGRNLMKDIVRVLGRMEPKLAGPTRQACERTRKTVLKAANDVNLCNSPYTGVVCLGYRVKTSGPTYAGKEDDWEDMKKRCDDLKSAIRSAYRLASTYGKDDRGRNYATNSNLLKIFMAPEFYFRGRNGAYDFNDVNGTKDPSQDKIIRGRRLVSRKRGILELMGEEIDQPIYKDWLFVLGTAIAASKSTKTVCAECAGDVRWVVDKATSKSSAVCKGHPEHRGTNEEVLGAMIENVALIKKDKDQYTVSKELVSHIDFIKDETDPKNVVKDTVKLRGEDLPVYRNKQPSGYDAASEKRSKFQDERMGGSVFSMDGITFGLEICLDHAAKPGSGRAGRLENAANIQIQLIPSAGMQIGKLRTIQGGVVFNVDGATPHVQVVAGQSPEIRYDIANGDNSWQLSYPKNVKWEKFPGMQALATKTELEKWKSEDRALKISAGGGSGSVLLYGPYEIPAV